jgi:hypothetical protein
VIAFSAPGANVYPGDKRKTLALARLINEQTAAYARAYPDKFAFYAVVPLPYTQDAIAEMNYAFETLGAAGIVLFSNYEGRYLGDPAFTPFFQALNARGQGQLVYVHPSTPYIKVDGKFIEANPTTYPTGMTEFFFETARTLQDLTISQTIHNFTNVNYIIPHVGGAFPAILDRFLKSLPQLYDASLKILQTRCCTAPTTHTLRSSPTARRWQRSRTPTLSRTPRRQRSSPATRRTCSAIASPPVDISHAYSISLSFHHPLTSCTPCPLEMLPVRTIHTPLFVHILGIIGRNLLSHVWLS